MRKRYLKLKKVFGRTNAFTIVELIIAIGLFVGLFGIVSGSFVNAMRTEREIVATVAANDSAHLSLEQIMREIRTGSNFTIRTDLPGTGNLEFTNYKGEDVTYTMTGNRIERGVSNVFKPITADNVQVKTLSFLICDPVSCPTPRVTIIVAASPTDPALAAVVFNMQTSVSARFQ